MRNSTCSLLAISVVAMTSCSDKDNNPAASDVLDSPGDQKVLTSDFRIGSQADLDSLGAQMGSVSTIVTGDLTIEEADDIVDLSVLAGLSRVGGDFEILDNDVLLSLNGLQNLTTVTGFLSICSNAKLSDLDSLSSLRRVGSFLSLGFNSSLTNINGLTGLIDAGSVQIFLNPVLESLVGLSGLTETGDLRLVYNPKLVSLEGLCNLTRITQSSLRILDHEALITLEGLENLAYIEQHLEVQKNPVLTDISGLAGLNHVGETIVFTDNTSLNVAAVQGFIDSLDGFEGNVRIIGNQD